MAAQGGCVKTVVLRFLGTQLIPCGRLIRFLLFRKYRVSDHFSSRAKSTTKRVHKHYAVRQDPWAWALRGVRLCRMFDSI